MPTVYESNVDFIQLAEKYAGKWVALHPSTSQVLAVGASAKEVVMAVASLEVEDPIIVKVAQDYGAFIPCSHA